MRRSWRNYGDRYDEREADAMPQVAQPFPPMDVGQARSIVDFVENPQNPAGVGLLTWAHYYRAKIALLQSELPATDKIRYTHLARHPRALNAAELEAYIAREAEYMQERLMYVEKKLQQLWQTAGLSERQAQIVREGLELAFTYRELTEMWERGS
ncbi:MAG TPA: hypothetical protein VNP04_04115 [Alphaproteobacteria bacterium]|nr:hypothetical protein [Alphaproteobacteria bacterium]